jgi:tetratricopeptide (TPR) repeat protein
MKKTLAILAAYFLAFVGVLSGLLGLYSSLSFTFLADTPWNAWAVLVMALLLMLGAAIVVIIRGTSREDHTKPADSTDLYQALVTLMRQALDAADYREVVRLGDSLSRPLFESGEFVVRLELGKLTEEAAAHLGAKDVQYRMLIDAIGWSHIELGNFSEAEKNIKHGLALAEENGDPFYRAKALRHLGAIARRRGRVDEAMQFYETARAASTDIVNVAEAQAMEAGITYAAAHLEYSRREFKGALASVDHAISLFRKLEDIYRLDMALVLKADIQIALKDPNRAKDTYRNVIQSSGQNRESVHYARAVLGLAELFIEDQEFGEAGRLLDRLNAGNVTSLPAFAERFRVATAAAKKKVGPSA